MTRQSVTFAIGEKVPAERDQYELLAELGRGGMGVVYKAKQSSFQRIVALKTFQNNFDQTALQRLLLEAKLVAQLSHPNIVQVYSTDLAGGMPFLVMEFIDGLPLNTVLREKKRLPLDEFYRVFTGILAALQCVHDHGLVHRDIKPSNIMIAKDGTAKLTDFGVAKDLGAEQMQRMTQTGAMLGSPAYMSPEQCSAQPVDARSDLYSLACTMYEALAGEPPFKGESALDVMYQHLNSETTTLTGITQPALSAVIGKALQKKPEDRFASATEFRDALLKAREGEQVVQKRASSKPHKPRSNPALLPAIAAVCLLCTACYFLWQQVQQPAPTPVKGVAELLPETADMERFGEAATQGMSVADATRWSQRFEAALAQTDSESKNIRFAGARYSFASSLVLAYQIMNAPREKLAKAYEVQMASLPVAWPHERQRFKAYEETIDSLRSRQFFDESNKVSDELEKDSRATNYPAGIAIAEANRGMVAFYRKDSDKAIFHLERALEQYNSIEPCGSCASARHLEVLSQLANSYLAKKQYDKTIQIVDRGLPATELLPFNGTPASNQIYFQRRVSLAQLGMDAAAYKLDLPLFKCYEKIARAATVDANNPVFTLQVEDETRYLRAQFGTLLYVSEKNQDALNVAKSVADKTATNQSEWNSRYLALIVLMATNQRLQKWQQTIDYANAAEDTVAHTDAAPEALLFRCERALAMAKAHTGRHDEARNHFDKAAALYAKAPKEIGEPEITALNAERAAFDGGKLK